MTAPRPEVTGLFAVFGNKSLTVIAVTLPIKHLTASALMLECLYQLRGGLLAEQH
ncbi:hypothetical protein VCHA53O466_140006 [Vibrio chagasii]|nr:hypothetical protein VCHA53O466_140006 [Vibrio chagasii]